MAMAREHNEEQGGFTGICYEIRGMSKKRSGFAFCLVMCTEQDICRILKDLDYVTPMGSRLGLVGIPDWPRGLGNLQSCHPPRTVQEIERETDGQVTGCTNNDNNRHVETL